MKTRIKRCTENIHNMYLLLLLCLGNFKKKPFQLLNIIFFRMKIVIFSYSSWMRVGDGH